MLVIKLVAVLCIPLILYHPSSKVSVSEPTGGRAAGPAHSANINNPAVAISGQSRFLSYHLALLWKPDCPAGFFWLHICVWARTQKHIYVSFCISVLCASKNHREGTKTTHLVPFRMPGILCLLGSDYFPSPHAGCAGEQINYAAQHNVLPIHTGRVWVDKD